MAACGDLAKIGNISLFQQNNKYIGDSKYITIKRSTEQYLAFEKRASELGEICLVYITIHEDLSLESHMLLHTCHKHLSLA
jgi:hypothetical protein